MTTGNLNESLLSYIHFTTNTYSVVDNFTNIRGNHTLKAGFEIRDVRSYRTQGGLPTYTYNNTADLIADNPAKIQLIFNTSKRNFSTDYGFYAQDDCLAKFHEKNMIASQFIDHSGNASMDIRHNPTGSAFAVEALTSPDGRILGKIGHSERIGEELYKNVPGNYNLGLFEAGVGYFA